MPTIRLNRSSNAASASAGSSFGTGLISAASFCASSAVTPNCGLLAGIDSLSGVMSK